MNPIHDCFAKVFPASAMILAAGLCIGTAFAQEPGKSITIDPNKTTITTARCCTASSSRRSTVRAKAASMPK